MVARINYGSARFLLLTIVGPKYVTDFDIIRVRGVRRNYYLGMPFAYTENVSHVFKAW